LSIPILGTISIKMKKNYKLTLQRIEHQYQFDFYFRKYFQVVKQLKFYFTTMRVKDIFEMINLNNKFYFIK